MRLHIAVEIVIDLMQKKPGKPIRNLSKIKNCCYAIYFKMDVLQSLPLEKGKVVSVKVIPFLACFFNGGLNLLSTNHKYKPSQIFHQSKFFTVANTLQCLLSKKARFAA